MAATTSSGTPVPTLGDLPNVPADMLRMATYLEPITAPRFTSDANASLGLPGRLVGQGAIINGIAKRWNGSAWVATDSLTPTSSGSPIAGTLPANAQLRWNGGMAVTSTNSQGHISIGTGFSTCLLTAWVINADASSDLVGYLDVPSFTNVTSIATRWRVGSTRAFVVSGLIRLVWGAYGI